MTKTLGDAFYVRLVRRASHDPWQHTLVDREDFERVSAMRWRPIKSGHSVYAEASDLDPVPKHHRFLHAFIMRVEPGQMVDHISGDTLDNRRQNLRVCSAAENARNSRRPTFPGKTSHFKGVSWDRQGNYWSARITYEGERFELGAFASETEAAHAYDAAALRHFGEFARTNAALKLFDGPMVVPDCAAATEFDGKVSTPRRHLGGRSLTSKASYGQRLDAKLRAEIAAFEAKN